LIKTISVAGIALAMGLASCQNSGEQADSSLKNPANVAQNALGRIINGGAGKGSFHFDGKEYLISVGDKSTTAQGPFSISIAAIPGVNMEGFIGGAQESSVTLRGAISAAGLIARLGEELSAKGYSRKSMIIGEGLASATWLTADGSASARIYAMENNGSVVAKIVARLEGAKR